jgi:hypothetical protein
MLRLMLALTLAATGVLAGCGDDDDASPAAGSWRAVPDAPVSPRWSPLGVWTGREAIFLGGGIDPPCPPNASCVAPDEMARDGAAYDPATDTWRRVADAPVPIGYWFRTAVVGQTVVVYGDGRWLAYDVGADRWKRLPRPPERAVDSGSISALDGRVYTLGRSHSVLVLDVADQTWTRLPADPTTPALDPWSVVATDVGVFVCGVDASRPDDGDTPQFTLVDRWRAGRWTRFPQTGSVGDLCQHWTCTRLVSADIQTATGLDGNPPYGGRLDPATGAWSPLPHAPDVEDRHADGWSVVAADGPLMAGWGYVYDDDAGTWDPLGKPTGTDVDLDQAAVWADGELVVFGGLDEQTGYEDPAGLSDRAFVWSR